MDKINELDVGFNDLTGVIPGDVFDSLLGRLRIDISTAGFTVSLFLKL